MTSTVCRASKSGHSTSARCNCQRSVIADLEVAMDEGGVEDVSPGSRASQKLLSMWGMPRSVTKDKTQSSGTKGERKGLRDVTNVSAALPSGKKKEKDKQTEILITNTLCEPQLAAAQTQPPSPYYDADGSLAVDDDVGDEQYQANANSAIKARAPTIK